MSYSVISILNAKLKNTNRHLSDGRAWIWAWFQILEKSLMYSVVSFYLATIFRKEFVKCQSIFKVWEKKFGNSGGLPWNSEEIRA